MNNKGFTLVELLATLIILSLVAGIAYVSMIFNFQKTKEKTEEIFVDTLKDAVDVYLSSDFGSLKIDSQCLKTLSKKHNTSVKVYRVYNSDGMSITFKDIIDSKYKPITKQEFVNPVDEYVECNVNAVIDVYRDEDYVYYYSIDKSGLNCLKNIGGDYDTVISNLPILDSGEYYSCS